MPSLVGMADTIAPERLSPSGLAAPGQPLGRALGQEDIARTIQAFADAALLARDAGFDGVEIHAAHGYLPDQFFWAATNQRQDRYGGPLRDRARFGAEIVAACKARVGDDFHVQMRISQWKQSDYAARVAQTPEDLADWLRPLVQAGVDMFHVSTRRYWDAAFPGRAPTLAGWVRRVTGTPVMAVGSVTLDRDFKAPDGKLRAETVPTQIASIEDAISAGEFDMIAVGRALLANPDWPQIVASGALDRIKPFDRACLETLH
ncbi:MAG: 12-oxophytodienoate reductase, partial [Gemmobacter sp.]|nr:12-oxophytodienoate reductase [Gemmobacter sp.]